MEGFPERLREARESIGEIQSNFARRVGVSRATMSYYENGMRTPDIDTLRRIHEETGVSLYYLLGLQEPASSASSHRTGLTPAAVDAMAKHPEIPAAVNRICEAENGAELCARLVLAVNASAITKSDMYSAVAEMAQGIFEDHFSAAAALIRSIFTAQSGDDLVLINGVAIGTADIYRANLVSKLLRMTQEQLDACEAYVSRLEEEAAKEK